MRIRLEQTFGAHTGRSFAFDQELVRIGRMPDSDVAFDAHADLDASGRHAELRRQGSAWSVVDLGSRNGTWVNGQRVDQRVLAHGDELEFGPGGPRLRVELVPPSVVPPPPGASTRGATPAAVGAATGPMTPLPADAAPAFAVPTPAISSSHASLPPATPTPGAKQYGQRTVNFMIQDAVRKARAGRGLKIAVGVLAALLVLVLAVLGVLVLRAGGERRGPDPAHVTAANAGALFRLAETSGGETNTFCTAFAVRRQILATTARCVLAIEARRGAGSTIDARGVAGTTTVQRLWRHPSFDPAAAGPDVGLVEIETPAPSLVTLATLDRVTRLDTGDLLLGYGYGASEVARTVEMRVGSVTTDAQGRQIQHGSAAGVGAPVFDASGAVVGVHSTGPGEPGPAAQGAGYVIGADALLSLLAGLAP
ncbi:MAG: FHA domain-containing protein [Myxococcota bacterium]